MTKWVELTGEAAVDPDSEDPDFVYPNVRKRVYGADGKRWPRLVLGAYFWKADVYRTPDDSVKISASIKDKPGQWYVDCQGIPVALLDDAVALAREVTAACAPQRFPSVMKCRNCGEDTSGTTTCGHCGSSLLPASVKKHRARVATSSAQCDLCGYERCRCDHP